MPSAEYQLQHHSGLVRRALRLPNRRWRPRIWTGEAPFHQERAQVSPVSMALDGKFIVECFECSIAIPPEPGREAFSFAACSRGRIQKRGFAETCQAPERANSRQPADSAAEMKLKIWRIYPPENARLDWRTLSGLRLFFFEDSFRDVFQGRFFDTKPQSQGRFRRTHSCVLPELCPKGSGCVRVSHPSTRRSWRSGCCAQAMSLGFVAATPYGNIHRYDFIVDGRQGLQRVQVRASSFMRTGGISAMRSALQRQRYAGLYGIRG